MGIYAVNRDIRRSGVEVFALYAAYLAAVNGIGKIGIKTLKIEVIRTAAYLLVGSEADAQRTVTNSFIGGNLGAQGDYLGDSRLIVRAEQGRVVGDNQLAPDILRVYHGGIRAVKGDYPRLYISAADIGTGVHMRDKSDFRAVLAALGRGDMPVDITRFVAHGVGDSRASKLLDEVIREDELNGGRGHGVARLVGSGFNSHVFKESFGNGHFSYHLRFFISSMIAQTAEFGNSGEERACIDMFCAVKIGESVL